jgi:thiamine thiazole synthase
MDPTAKKEGSLIHETAISRAILGAYQEKLAARLETDVVVVGAGPSGLVAAADLSARGMSVLVLEKRLSPGGGVWGGGMGMNEVVVQDEAAHILGELGVRDDRMSAGLRTVDAIELACSLCIRALRAGAVILNLITVEDVCIHDGRVSGVVVNRTTLAGGGLPVDPLTVRADHVIDATGHDAAVVSYVRRRGLLKAVVAEPFGEGAMDAAGGERFVVERAGEVFPGLWICGMSVCATYGGPRMGPIFGGMLLSGRQVAAAIAAARR